MTATLVVPSRIRWHRGLRLDGRPARLADLTSNPAGARSVMRPSWAGNPYTVHRHEGRWQVWHPTGRRSIAVDREEAHVEAVALFEDRHLPVLLADTTSRWHIESLAGMDLACACREDLWCHTIPLLKAANPDLPETTWSQP